MWTQANEGGRFINLSSRGSTPSAGVAANRTACDTADTGRDGDLDNWRDLHAEASRAHNNRTASYLIGTPMLADYLEEALTQFGKSFEDFEGHL